MLFNIKSTFLIGLVASTTLAAPSISLVPRAKTPAKVNCDGKEFTAAELTAGITAARGGRGSYPKKFKNKNPAGAAVFPNHPVVNSADQSNIWEMPIGPEFPGKYRVVMNNGYSYVGTMYHTGPANDYYPCTPVADAPDNAPTPGDDDKNKKPGSPSAPGPDDDKNKKPGNPSVPDNTPTPDDKDKKNPQTPGTPGAPTPDDKKNTPAPDAPDNKQPSDGTGSGRRKKGGKKGGKN